MTPKTSLGVWRASFLATLGLYPLQSLVACSSDTSANMGQGSEAGPTGTGGSSGAGAGGKPSGGAVGAGGGTAAGGSEMGGSGAGGVQVPGMGGTHPGSGGFAGAGGAVPDAGQSSAACLNPQAVVVMNQLTGFVACQNGDFHRSKKVTCPTSLPRSTTCGTGPLADAAIANGECASDKDCKAQPNGYCQASGVGIQGCFCNYGCRTDADCGADQICTCSDPVGACAPAANCTVDSDCGLASLCISSSDGACGVVFACQTKDDTCAGSGDCNPSLGTGGSSSAGGAGGAGGAGCLSDGGCIARMCSFVPAVSDGGPDAGQKGSHQCTPVRPCGTGRPFLVGGAARVADVARRSDWSSSIAPCLDGLDEAARDALAVHWTDVGLMEHASIAAFARFALELLSLGAPPALLVETQAALADETVHARDAFALASAYAGCHVGPGALQIDCALSARDPLEIVRTAILEGCIGETVAAVEATEALAHATDPAVRAALERVARDETRHAELAWRFIRWAVTSGSPAFAHSTRNALTSVVRSEIAAAERLATGAETPRAELLAHGALDSATRRDLRRRVLVEIIEPCARALAESRESAGPSAVMVA